MQITSLLSGYSDPTSVTSLLDSSGASSSKKAEQSASASSTTQATSDQIRSIVSRYNLESITPQQFSEMLQSLREAGALSDQQYQELSQLRADLESQGVDSDEPTNLLEYCSNRLKEIQKGLQMEEGDSTNTVNASTVSRWSVWLQKVALVQSSDDATTVNALV